MRAKSGSRLLPIFGLVALSVAACVMSEDARRVNVTEDHQKTAGCKFRGRVIAWDNESRLKVKAAEMGANVVWRAPGSETTRTADAYFCESQNQKK